jgi:hypothetical protein
MPRGMSQITVERYLKSVDQSYRIVTYGNKSSVLLIFEMVPRTSAYVDTYENIQVRFDAHRKLISVSEKKQYMGL